MPDFSADSTLDRLVKRILAGNAVVFDSLKSDLARKLRKFRNRPETYLLDEVRQLFEQHTPALARVLLDASLAAFLTGSGTILNMLPEDIAVEGTEEGLPEVSWEGMEVWRPLVEAAVRDLNDRRLVTRAEWDTMTEAARERSFTVAGQQSEEAVGRVRDAVQESIKTGETFPQFLNRVNESLETSTLGPGQAENVFRTATQTAYNRGKEKILEHPLVGDYFPYVENVPIRDSRLTELCAAVSVGGLDGTGIFRVDDPTWQKYRVPRHWQDRCLARPTSIRDAARKGVLEAQRWLETRTPPEVPEFVKPIPIPLPPGWVSGSVEMSICMAMPSWTAYKGPRGGEGWKSSRTGKVMYQEEMPGEHEHEGESEEPPHVRKAKEEYERLGVLAPAFKKWFGDWEKDPEGASKVVNDDGRPQKNTSKVIDEDGRPLVVLHGTHGKFNRFEEQDDVGGKFFGPGFYFTPDEDYANHFASTGFGKKKGRVMQLYLNIKNPYVVTNEHQENKKIRDEGYAGWEDYSVELRKQGYDGIKVTRFEGTMHREVDEWVAFHPHQIKSVENQGTFDPESDDIRFSTGEPCKQGERADESGCVPESGEITEHLVKQKKPLFSIRRLQPGEILQTTDLGGGKTAGIKAPLSPSWAIVDENGKVIKTKHPITGQMMYEIWPQKSTAEKQMKSKELQKASVIEDGVEFRTGKPVTFRFIRNTGKSPQLGKRFGQDIEPAGRYLLHSDETNLPAGWIFGETTFKNPLVIELTLEEDKIYGPQGWKARLSRAYGKKGKALSLALIKDGYDGIVTVNSAKKDTREIIDLSPLK